MASFNAYIPLLLQVEGGFQANPKDKGNYNSLGQLVGTFRGISARFYESIIGRPPTVADIKSISKGEATNLYRQHFWNKCQADKIRNQAVANTIVDHHVNAGSGVLLAQKVLNDYFGYRLVQDNAMGPKTLNAINAVNAGKFVGKYNQEREEYYRSLSNSSTFFDGWKARLKKFAYSNPATSIGTGVLIIVAAVLIGLHNLNK